MRDLELCGIFYVIRNGLQWKDAPRGYGPHKTLFCNGPLVVNP
jgi:transposase